MRIAAKFCSWLSHFANGLQNHVNHKRDQEWVTQIVSVKGEGEGGILPDLIDAIGFKTVMEI